MLYFVIQKEFDSAIRSFFKKEAATSQCLKRLWTFFHPENLGLSLAVTHC